MKRIGLTKTLVFRLFLSLFVLQTAASYAAETFKVGGFVAVQNDDGSWDAGLPACMGIDSPDVQGAQTYKGDADHIVLQVSSLDMPWKADDEDCKISLKSNIGGASVALDVKAYGTLAAKPDLSVYKDQSLVADHKVSFLSGPAALSLPDREDNRVVGLCVATAAVGAVVADDSHPLYELNGAKGQFVFATLQYVEDGEVDADITSVDALKKEGIRTINFVGFKLAVDGEDAEDKVYECRWTEAGAGQYLTGTSTSGTVEVSTLASTETGSTQKYTIPKETINSILPINLTTDLAAIQLKAPTGMLLVAELPGFSLPIPGLSEDLRFGKSTFTLTLGATHLGSKKAFSAEAVLENPGVVFGELGEGIGSNKKVGITVEGDTVIINFYNTIEDLKPLGFSLKNPVVALDISEKSVELSGTISFPDDLPLPLVGKEINVSGKLSKNNISFVLMTDVELAIFNDSVRMGLDTIVMGMCEKQLYFSCLGHAKFTKVPEEISLIPNLNISTNMELEASLFLQSDGTMHAELICEDMLSVNAGPINANLEEVALVLDHTKAGGWYASVSGTSNLNINASPFSMNITTSLTVDTDGTVRVEIPYDAENPTKVALGDLSISIEYGKLEFAKQADGSYGVTLDATVTTRLPDEIPIIGGQDLTGRMAAKSDGSFLFELTKIPQAKFCGMGVGLTDVRIENRKENGSFLLTFEAGAGVEFKSDFFAPPLRNQSLTGSVKVGSDLSAKFALNGPTLCIKDFEFGITELAIEVIKGRDLAISGSAGLVIKYPTSKYFAVGLPAAIAGKDTGPDFNIAGTVSVSTTNIYFEATSTAAEIPLEIPKLMETGITVGIEKIGAGITYAGIPLFDVKGSLYLPDLKGGGDTGVTPGLERPYDSKLGLALTCNVRDGLMIGFDTEGKPKIKLKPLFELGLYDLQLGTWMYGLIPSIDVGGKFQVGDPDAGFGAVLEVEGGHMLIQALPMPFWDRGLAKCNYGGFGFGLETEFPRPTPPDVEHAIALFDLLSKGDLLAILEECGADGRFNNMFPKFAVRQAYLRAPKVMMDVIHAPHKLDFLGGKDLEIDSGEIYPHLIPLIKAVANPKDTMASMISLVPEKMRAGDFDAKIGVGSFTLLSGKLKYKLQAREQVFVKRSVPKLSELLNTVDVVNEVESIPGDGAHMQWKMVSTDDGCVKLKNRKTEKYLALGETGKSGEPVEFVQVDDEDEDESLLWVKSAEGSDGSVNLFNRKSGSALYALEDGSLSQISYSSLKGKLWKLQPVYGTKYVYVVNNSDGKAVSAGEGLSGGIALAEMEEEGQVTALGRKVTVRSGKVELEGELAKFDSFVGKLRSISAETSSDFLKSVRAVASGKKISGNDSIGLTIALTDDTQVYVSPYGRVKGSVAMGALELRTELDNAPAPTLLAMLQDMELGEAASLGGYPYSGITTPRETFMGNPDCFAARTWKQLWSMRKGGPKNHNSTSVSLNLKNGVSAKMSVKAKCRVITSVRKLRRSGWRFYWVNVRVKKWMTVNRVAVNSGGYVYGYYDARHPGIRNYRHVMFNPGATADDGAGGLQDITLKSSQRGIVPFGGFEQKSWDPEYTFTLADKEGWQAKLSSGSLLVVAPSGEEHDLTLSSNIGETLADVANGADDGEDYGVDGKVCWVFMPADGGTPKSGTVSDVSGILDETGDSVRRRSLAWKDRVAYQKTVRVGWRRRTVTRYKTTSVNASISNSGALVGAGGLVPGSGSESSVEVSGSGARHKIVVSRDPILPDVSGKEANNSLGMLLESEQVNNGKYSTKVYLNKNDTLTPVQVIDPKKGIVNDPTFREIPTSLDLSGEMSIGNKILIQTAMAFAGHIDDDGGIALAANGQVTCHGLALSQGKFSFRHFPNGADNGLTFSGRIRAPYNGRLNGEIYENGNFHVAGNVEFFIPGLNKTGFAGSVCMDPKLSFLHGAVYANGKRISYAIIELNNSTKTFRFKTGATVKVGIGGYKKKIGWIKVKIPFTGVKGGLKSDINFKFVEPMKLSGKLRVYAEAKVVGKRVGKFDKTFTLPDLCKVRSGRVLGRRLKYRAIPLYMWWDAPGKYNPRIGHQ